MVVERALVLAAGPGSRLGTITSQVPKPMLEIAGRPLIESIIAAAAGVGVKAATVVTGYLADRLESHVAATSPVPVSFVRQPDPNGTAGAVQLARSAMGRDPFLLAWGDIATEEDHFTQVVAAWQPPLAATIGVNHLDDVSRHSAILFDEDHRISAIVEKPVGEPPSNWNNAGIMVFGPQIWGQLERVEPSSRGELELPDAINGLVAAGERLIAVPLRGRWFDIGTEENLVAARRAFSP